MKLTELETLKQDLDREIKIGKQNGKTVSIKLKLNKKYLTNIGFRPHYNIDSQIIIEDIKNEMKWNNVAFNKIEVEVVHEIN